MDAEGQPGEAMPRPIRARAVAPAAQPAPVKSSGSKGALIGLLGLLLMMSMCLNLTLVGGSGGGLSNGSAKLNETTTRPGNAQARVALVRVEGVIMNGGGGGLFATPGPDLTERIRLSFKQAAEDPSIKAVVLRVDSPGGGVTESDQIYKVITDFQVQTNKPVIVSMGGMCASGGYYISAPGDVVYAEPTTITGSIGVIFGGYNYAKLLEKIGVEEVNVTSGPNKDLLSAGKPVRPAHLEILQSTVDSMYERFVGIVVAGRKIDRETVDAMAIADGRIFTAEQALELKLIDEIGYLDAAIEAARQKGGAAGGAVIEYVNQPTFADLFQAKASVPSLEPRSLLGQGPRFLYLWKP